MAKQVQHEDFGEKIGGAKKDLWKERGLLSGDLEGMNSREADKYVKKDNIWKKPDYQAMIDGGLPVDVAYFIKTVRDSMDTAPAYMRGDDTPEKRLARQKEYIDTVREVQGVVEGVKTKADALAAFSRCMEDGGYFERMEPGPSRAYYATVTEKGKANAAITNKLAHALFFRSERDYQQRITWKAEKQQFGVSKDKKIPRGYEIRYHDGKNSYSKNDDWKPDTYFVAKGHYIIKTNLATEADAV